MNSFVGLLTVFFLSTQLAQANRQCGPVLSGTVKSTNVERVPAQSLNNLLVKVEELSRTGDSQMRFGFESEYTLEQLTGIVAVYGPDSSFGISSKAWLEMPVEQRVEWVKSNKSNLFPEKRVAGKLVRLAREDKLNFLPEALVLDSTGNVEFILPPTATFETWVAQVRFINETFGAGSMQATVGIPTALFFRAGGKDLFQANLGFLNFLNDYDTLSKLEKGHQRWQKDKTAEVALSFKHPFLGPMIKLKQDKLLEYLKGNSRGEMFEGEFRRMISYSDISFKYISGTVYRPDIAGPDYIVFEIRDAHNNFEILNDRMLRTQIYLRETRTSFEGASFFQALDSVKDFEKFPGEVRTLLAEVFPARREQGENYTEAEAIAVEVFRNFAFPMRSWEAQLNFLGRSDLSQKVESAQRSYLGKLTALAKQRPASNKEISVLIQGYLSEFAVESGLPEVFQFWLRKNLEQKLEQLNQANKNAA